ncbi:hypothetical protein RAB80_017599 [Fusarium oxysporum f. sp. vasinfectum]|uniref:BZIP domain-containing protein n=1 Tax=Fusarium oxysporum f. sp. vasinfectum 25433 TaxID=1089449 RepID=X0L3S1_FUSOX|nr:hypothetical protein FOTG_16055 [Fusarium oxysporum f. sp. vasinfectum 25433]KAK2667178.1 hypothetical protein RAB80_017599 [Fusarium oxysporum f. sp. vasinfectum]KAK2922737.1 hypothetical protein FoTM2_017590 [Fusarium oxysporum f. sp. vasinfectum]
MASSNFFASEECQFNNNYYAYEPKYSAQWASPTNSMQRYPPPSPATESTYSAMSTGGSESRRGSSLTRFDNRKCKRNTNKSTATKSTRRSSIKSKEMKTEDSCRKPKARAKAQPIPEPMSIPSSQEGEDMDDYNRRAQERNRITSTKFRVQKREDAKKLKANEEDMERANRDLSSCVSDLTLQVYQLKMRLLQHSDCDCHLIQDYIANEAHRYVQDLCDKKHPPHLPIERPRS